MMRGVDGDASSASAPTATIVIARRFRGPPRSGNGGYVAGRLARFVDAPGRSVAVRLNRPPPLEVPLPVRCEKNKAFLDAPAQAGETERPIAEARASELELALPTPPTFEQARAAAASFRGFDEHVFPGCFVCGTEREIGDGLRIFSGETDRSGLFAAPWVPDRSLVPDESRLGGSGASPIGAVRDHSGRGAVVPDEISWAALDCPGAFAFAQPEGKIVLLGEIEVVLDGTVRVGERCVLASWEIEHEGRKHETASALFGEAGDCRGRARGVWFEVEPDAVPRS